MLTRPPVADVELDLPAMITTEPPAPQLEAPTLMEIEPAFVAPPVFNNR